jgi:hypothetical protein
MPAIALSVVPAMFGYTLHILHEFLAIFRLRQVMLHV